MFTGDGVGGSGDFLMRRCTERASPTSPRHSAPTTGCSCVTPTSPAAVRCAPPDNKPTPEEIARCLDHLDAEVDALPHVRVVVALGKIAFDAWLQLLKRRGVTVVAAAAVRARSRS